MADSKPGDCITFNMVFCWFDQGGGLKLDIELSSCAPDRSDCDCEDVANKSCFPFDSLTDDAAAPQHLCTLGKSPARAHHTMQGQAYHSQKLLVSFLPFLPFQL